MNLRFARKHAEIIVSQLRPRSHGRCGLAMGSGRASTKNGHFQPKNSSRRVSGTGRLFFGHIMHEIGKMVVHGSECEGSEYSERMLFCYSTVVRCALYMKPFFGSIE